MKQTHTIKKFAAILMAAVLVLGLMPGALAEAIDLSQYKQVFVGGQTLYEDAAGVRYILNKDGKLVRYKNKTEATKAPEASNTDDPGELIITAIDPGKVSSSTTKTSTDENLEIPISPIAPEEIVTAIDPSKSTAGTGTDEGQTSTGTGDTKTPANTSGSSSGSGQSSTDKPAQQDNAQEPSGGIVEIIVPTVRSFTERHGVTENPTEADESARDAIGLHMLLTVNAETVTVGETVTVTASTSLLNGDPTGSLTFLDNGEPFSTGITLGNGTAIVIWTPATVGGHELTVQYRPGANDGYLESSGKQTVEAHAPTNVPVPTSEDLNLPAGDGKSAQTDDEILNSLLNAVNNRLQARKEANTEESTIAEGQARTLAALLGTTSTDSTEATTEEQTTEEVTTEATTEENTEPTTEQQMMTFGAGDEADTRTPVNITLAANPASVAAGESVKLTATSNVDMTGATGEVQFTAMPGNIAIGPAKFSGTTATIDCNTTGIAADTYTVTAKYVPGDNDSFKAGSDGTINVTVTGEDIRTPVNITLTANPASVAAGESVKLTATSNVDMTGATGEVQFTAMPGNIAVGPAKFSGNTATIDCNTTGIAAGTYTVTAKYVPGDSDSFKAGSDGTTSVTVTKSVTNLTVDTTEKRYTGSAIELVVKDGETTLVKGTHYNITYSPDNINVDEVTATITGIAPYSGTREVKFNIVKETYVKIELSASGGQGGTPVILTATVTGTGGAKISGGTVTFYNGDTKYLPNIDVKDGVAKISIPGLKEGPHTLGAKYNGTDNIAASDKVTTTVTVTKGDPKATFTVSGGQGGAPVVLTLKLEGPEGGATPTGKVVFGDGTNTYPNKVDVKNGVATLTVANPGKFGTYTYTAKYEGDECYNATGTLKGEITIGKATPTVVLEVRGGYNGTPAKMAASVIGPQGGFIPTGYVEFRVGNSLLARVRLDNYGDATFTWNDVPWTHYVLTAHYTGDGHYTSATSNEVRPNDPDDDDDRYNVAVWLEASMNKNNKDATLKATITGRWWNNEYTRYDDYWYKNNEWYYDSHGYRYDQYGNRIYNYHPTGNVAFYSGNKHLGTAKLVNGVAELTWKDVPIGTSTIVAVYSGDLGHRSGRASVTLTRKASSSSGSSSSGSGSASTSTKGKIVIRDAGGNIVETYDTAGMTMFDGILTLQTTRSQDFYSYAIPVSQMRSLSNSSDGYYNLVTPSFNCYVPYDLINSVEGLPEYIRQKGLSDSNLELRISIRKINASAMSAATSALSGMKLSDFYRVDVQLYSTSGSQYDFVAGLFDAPLQLLIPNMQNATSAMMFDEATNSLIPVGLGYADGAAMIMVEENGIYVAVEENKG